MLPKSTGPPKWWRYVRTYSDQVYIDTWSMVIHVNRRKKLGKLDELFKINYVINRRVERSVTSSRHRGCGAAGDITTVLWKDADKLQSFISFLLIPPRNVKGLLPKSFNYSSCTLQFSSNPVLALGDKPETK